jgi:phthalate 4,5-dioxygenase
LGLLDRACPHRGADLAFARRKYGGLRCPFHGSLFDVTGGCLETPAEPEGRLFHRRIRQASCPVCDINGLIFAYLGAGGTPLPLPDFDCFIASDSHSLAFKGFMVCNWLQALEVGIAPAHASFLHRFEENESTETGYGRQLRAASIGSNIPMTTRCVSFRGRRSRSSRPGSPFSRGLPVASAFRRSWFADSPCEAGRNTQFG